MATPSYTHKRGDTLNLQCVYKDASGAAVDITGFTIESQIRDSAGVLIEELDCTLTDPTNGVFTVSKDATATALWTVGTHRTDIQITDLSGTVTSTETINFKVAEDVTRDA